MRKDNLFGFVSRYAVVHTVIYIIIGIFFMVVSDYFEFFAENELLDEIMRPSTDNIVRMAPLIQIFRGSLIGLAIYPFRSNLYEKNGWLKLFGLIFVLTSVGAVINGPGSIEGILYTRIGLVNPLIGYPEVFFQALILAYLFCKWENKVATKNLN